MCVCVCVCVSLFWGPMVERERERLVGIVPVTPVLDASPKSMSYKMGSVIHTNANGRHTFRYEKPAQSFLA